MSLKRRTIIIVTVSLIGLLAGVYLLMSSFIARGFGDVERQWANDNVLRVQEAYKAMEVGLISKSADWAVWSDMYQFVVDKNEPFIDSNLGNVSFSNLRIDYMLYLNDKDEEVWSKHYDVDEDKEKPFDPDLKKLFAPGSDLLKFKDLDDIHSGVLMSQGKPVVFVARPILTSDHTGPSHGTLVFMKKLTDTQVQNLSKTVKFPLSIEKVATSNPSPMHVSIVDDNTLEGYLLTNDYFGNPAFIFKVILQRDIHGQAQKTIRTIGVFLLIAAGIFIVVMIIVLNELLIKRLTQLGQEIAQLTKQQEQQFITFRLDAKGQDEFSAVALTINRLLEAMEKSALKIKESDASLRDKEKEILAQQQKRLAELEAINKQIIQKSIDLEKMQAANLNIMEDLQVARHDAEIAGKAKSQFLANMSHEIRTPLNAVLGFSDLLRQSSLDEDQKKYLTTITTSGELLLSIINDILDISKIEAGHVHLESIDFNVKELVESTFNIVKEKVSGKPVELQFDIKPEVGAWYKGDPTRIRQIIVNLLSNAAKFTKEGHIRLTIDREKVLDKEGKQGLRFKVSDTGIGIAKEKLRAIFEPFTQEDSSTTRKFGGTGLGLTICQNLAGMMSGEIWVESEQGKGSDFIFTVLLSPGQAQTKVEVKVAANNVDLKGVRVLVVDDSMPNQQLIKAFFGMFGCQGVYANNGQEAVDILRNDTNFNLCLMDMQMPVLGGVDATRIIRAEISKDIPIIALTAAALKEDQEKAYSAGMNDFLTKPIEMNKLKAAIISYVRK